MDRIRIFLIGVIICMLSILVCSCADSVATSPNGETADRATDTLLPGNEDKVTIGQGIWGNVWFWSGNHMPSPDKNYTTGTIEPVEREIRIYERTAADQVTESDTPSFYTDIQTRLVEAIVSDSDGFFQVELTPGSYSLLVMENGVLHCTELGGDGSLYPVTVEAESVTKQQVDITYQATF